MVSDKQKPKRKKTPRPHKPPIVPFEESQYVVVAVSIWQQKQIARVIMAWSKLEGALHDLIWTIIGVAEEDGRILTKSVGAKMLIPMARALAVRHITGDDLDALHQVLDLADMRREDRDIMAHGVWSTLMADDVPMALSHKPNSPEGTVVTETFPKDRMKGILEDILKARDEIYRVRNALATSRDQSSELHHPDLLHRPLSPKSGNKKRR